MNHRAREKRSVKNKDEIRVPTVKLYLFSLVVVVFIGGIWALFRFGNIAGLQLWLQDAVPFSWFMPAFVVANGLIFVIAGLFRQAFVLPIIAVAMLFITAPYIASPTGSSNKIVNIIFFMAAIIFLALRYYRKFFAGGEKKD